MNELLRAKDTGAWRCELGALVAALPKVLDKTI
jgi:hypothetical protein